MYSTPLRERIHIHVDMGAFFVRKQTKTFEQGVCVHVKQDLLFNLME